MSLINREDLMQTLGITDMDCEKCGWYSRTARRCKRGSDFEDACCAIDDALEVEPEPHWIPVSERLPEPRVDVWVNSDIGQIQGYYEEHIGIWYASFGQGRDYLELIVTAWMPLPEPYRAERRTDDSISD